MRLSKNYSGHQIDVLVLDVPDSIEGAVPPAFSNNFRIAAGLQKLAQIYIIKLFTALESKVLDKERGTAIGDLLVGQVSTTEDFLNHIINVGHVETVAEIFEDQELRIDDDKVIPDDEFLVEADLVDLVILDPSSVKFTVRITTNDSTGTYIIPIRFPVGS